MKRTCWAFIVPVLLAVLLLTPRLLDARFGLLDDAVTIVTARGIAHDPLAAFLKGGDTGRFFPLYFYYYLLVCSVSGENPVAFYAVNLLALSGCAVLLAWAALRRGGNLWQAAATGSIFLLSVPVSSTFNTLSKAEVPQCLFLCAALAAGSPPAWSVPRVFITAVLLLMAIFSKETSYAVVPAAGAMMLIHLLRGRDWKASLRSRQTYFFLAACLAAAVSYAAWRFLRPGTPGTGTYAGGYGVTMDRVVNAFYVLAVFGMRSWAYLVPVFAGMMLLWKRAGETARSALLEGLVWAAMFTAILTPWPGLFEYHLAPAAIGVALAAGFSVPALAEACRRPGPGRWGGAAALTVGAILMPMSVANIVADQRIQMLVDRVNFRLVEELSRLPQNSRVYFNMPPHEYLFETQLYLRELFGRKDLSVDVYNYDHRAAVRSNGSYYVVSSNTDQFLGVFVRGPLRDLESKFWNQMLSSFIAPPSQVQVAARFEEKAQREDFALQQVLRFDRDRPFHLSRRLTYGWTVYKVAQAPTEAPVPVIVRADGVWEFHPEGGAVRTLKLGQPGDIPLKADLDGDGRDAAGFYRPADGTWHFDRDMDGREDLRFRLDDMQPGDAPLVGDWDGNGTDTAGFYRAKDSSWHLHNRNAPGNAEQVVGGFGAPGAIPLTGRWNHAPRTSIGFYRPQTGETYLRLSLTEPEVVGYALEGDGVPVAADWSGMGFDTLALARRGKWTLRRANSVASPFGTPQVLDVTGEGYGMAARWQRLP